MSQESCTFRTFRRHHDHREIPGRGAAVPLDSARSPRAAFPLEHGPEPVPAFRSLFPPPARRPAPAGRPKAGVYLAAIVVRRTASPQSIASTVARGAAFARRARGSPEVGL